MNHKQIKTLAYLFIIALLTGIGLFSCKNKSMEGMLVVTRIPANNFDHINAINFSNLPKAELIAVHQEEEEAKITHLTSDFYSACSPHLSYDAKELLFLGQKSPNDSWQVWEMNLKKKNYRQLTDFKESCYSPYYLPGERFVFSKDISDTLTGPSRMLFTMNLDGTNLQQITFHPHNDYVQTILSDGRILMLSQQIYPEKGEIKTLALRPNGTKAEIFYPGNEGHNRGFRFCETSNGIIYFIEQDAGDLNKMNLISIHQNRPLHSKVNCSDNIEGNFYSLYPKSENELIVSYRPSDNQNIGIYIFSTDKKTVKEYLISDSEYHYLDPVLVKAYKRPKNLPNELKEEFPSGLIMCQNINLTAQADSSSENFQKATKIEILGTDKSLGIVSVQEDGSFFLKVKADVPFRIQTLDENNEVVIEPSDWIWVRPFERRGCVGCHEDHELAPENVVPMAVNHSPVPIPADSLNLELNKKIFELGDMH